MKGEKESVLFKKLDLAFVYGIIFVVGVIIVLIMTSYINDKVQEFTSGAVSTTQNQ